MMKREGYRWVRCTKAGVGSFLIDRFKVNQSDSISPLLYCRRSIRTESYANGKPLAIMHIHVQGAHLTCSHLFSVP